MCDERKMKAGSFSLSDTVIGWFGGEETSCVDCPCRINHDRGHSL